ncbi:heat-inducible transcriptional repressor HrcA [Leptolyngbya sp. BC1307]|uniref:heat-inducible transcriptional repressor HrcA n=1 Tax=Leptolyngbya sp. BC1307 TaxID=2029589 RepID=UPI000EFB6D0C|nr:heat-inducible transcriptional repressor HrcA [Leptolyngbya sp. BC1307]
MQLTPRQQNVLRATVRHYVSTAEPVGSKSLAKGYNLRVSSATIRSVMSVLEDSGLLYQPHTSAGRIPSDSGYRAYVNELMTPSEPLTRRMETTLNQRIGWQGQAIEALLQESAQILASLSGYIALVTMPQLDEPKIKHLQLVRVSDRQLLLLVVFDVYSNHSILLPLPRQSDRPLNEVGSADSDSISLEEIDRELQVLSNFLTEQLRGGVLNDVVLDWSDLDLAFQRYISGLQQGMVDLARRSRVNPATQILVSGLAEVLDQPEFAERSQVRSLVQLLEDGRDQLWPLISTARLAGETDALVGAEISNNRRLRIWIGTENPVAPMQTCALVTSLYGSAPGPVGSLGVLGPTRMLYENAVAAVEAAANHLTEAVSSTLQLGEQLTPEG